MDTLVKQYIRELKDMEELSEYKLYLVGKMNEDQKMRLIRVMNEVIGSLKEYLLLEPKSIR